MSFQRKRRHDPRLDIEAIDKLRGSDCSVRSGVQTSALLSNETQTGRTFSDDLTVAAAKFDRRNSPQRDLVVAWSGSSRLDTPRSRG